MRQPVTLRALTGPLLAAGATTTAYAQRGVGIGTSEPARKLDVNGSANVTGTLQLSNTTLDKAY